MERTVDYAGLERATNVKTGDVRSDIFFLGCVLYEILTGRAPIETTRDRNARMAQQRFQQVPPLPPDEVQAPPSVFALVDTMLSLDPPRRFQTPSQLLDAIKAARRDVEGKNSGGVAGRTIFIVEKAENLQDKMRDRFKELGYRVMLSGDPTRALERYRQNPFDALIVDAGTVGEDGRLVFQQIMAEATHRQLRCAGILLLAQNQADWASRIKVGKNSAILPLGVKFGQVVKKLDELLAVAP